VVRQRRQAAVETANVVSYLVILEVDNRSGKLLPGMTANVEIVTGRAEQALRVPTTALRFRPKAGDRPAGKAVRTGSHVFVVNEADPYKPVRKAVKLGLQGEEYVQVTAGLRQGEKVLVRTRSTSPTSSAPDDEENSADDGQ
jgi:HlyD family secretion protein